MKKVTIYEIAAALKIDSSTVSRALNNNARVSQQTKEKVLRKAKELGYNTNLLASNLRQNKSNTIGVVVPRISRYFFSSIIAGIEESAFAEGYNVIISQSLEQLNREKKIINNFVANRVDGVLISIAWESDDFSHLKHLQDIHMPLVFFDRHFPELKDSNKVIVGDFDGAYRAVEHLIKMGCRKIAHFAGPQNLEVFKNRLKGYKAALNDYNLSFDPNLIVESSLLKVDGYTNMENLLRISDDIDGVFSGNDAAAVGAIQFLKGKSIRVPEDIAFVGFSNDPLSEVVEPALSTVEQFGFEMGKRACEMLIQNINSKEVSPEPQTLVIAPKLILRQSSRKVKLPGSPLSKKR